MEKLKAPPPPRVVECPGRGALRIPSLPMVMRLLMLCGCCALRRPSPSHPPQLQQNTVENGSGGGEGQEDEVEVKEYQGGKGRR